MSDRTISAASGHADADVDALLAENQQKEDDKKQYRESLMRTSVELQNALAENQRLRDALEAARSEFHAIRANSNYSTVTTRPGVGHLP
jgi:hypothetical protein